MNETSRTITITETEAQRIVWALHRLSDWMQQSKDEQSHIDKGVRKNDEIIDRIRAPFLADK